MEETNPLKISDELFQLVNYRGKEIVLEVEVENSNHNLGIDKNQYISGQVMLRGFNFAYENNNRLGSKRSDHLDFLNKKTIPKSLSVEYLVNLEDGSKTKIIEHIVPKSIKTIDNKLHITYNVPTEIIRFIHDEKQFQNSLGTYLDNLNRILKTQDASQSELRYD